MSEVWHVPVPALASWDDAQMPHLQHDLEAVVMNDRELLELAAKAVGITIKYNYLGTQDARCPWNPLEDDSDALRLAVKLRISVEMDEQYVFGMISSAEHVSGLGMCECWNSDPYAATRRAIVRAAAAIGEKM